MNRKIETKLIKGEFTYDKALEIKEEGWRLPTYFELLKLSEEGEEEDNNWYWSSSPYAAVATITWGVGFGNGSDGVYLKSSGFHVRLVRSGQDFDFCHSVSDKEAIAFKESGELPDWHPLLEEAKQRRKLTKNSVNPLALAMGI